MNAKHVKWLAVGVVLALVVSMAALYSSGIDYQVMGVSHYTSHIEMVDADIRVEGNVLDLDADNDTGFTADTDDQVDLEINGADEWVFTADQLDATNGQVVNIGNAGTDFSADGGLTTAGGITVTTGGIEVTVGGVVVNAGVLALDADDDTSLTADTDDQIDFELGAADEYQMTVDKFDLLTNYLEADIDTEHIMFPTVATTSFTYTAAAGGTVTLWTIAAGEIWIVHDIYCNITTDFDCTGEDCKVDIGDDTDPDGLCDLDDAELQAADTEVTGAPAGWQCMCSGDTIGAWFTSGRGFIYAPSGSAQTIDAVIDEDSGETLSAGAATCYIVYTRIQ